MTLIDKAEPHDDDLIRRGDALEICTDYGFSRADECRDAIAALPAVTIQQITAEVAKAVPAHDAAIREEALQQAVTAVRQALIDAAHAHRADKPTSSAMFKAETYATNAILALIQKGGDAHDKTPIDARPETSPGVTAGAISKGAADDR